MAATALEIVQSLYAAFGRGDIPAILAQVSDEVQWEAWSDNRAQQAGVPWLKGGSGKQAAVDFFTVVAGIQFHEFQVLGMMANERQVAVELVIDATPSGGQRVRDEEIHLWTLDERGKVTRMRHYLDTAKHMRAAGVAA